jgi:hypothetical protein
MRYVRLVVPAVAIAFMTWAQAARAQCPVSIPVPVDANAAQCFTVNRPPTVRCATVVASSVCGSLNDTAFNRGLLTPDAEIFLATNRFCSIAVDLGAGPQVFDFCPTTACTPALPGHANSLDVACFTTAKPTITRCPTALAPAVCDAGNLDALNRGLLTSDGYRLLVNAGFCAIVNDLGQGPAIFDFCARGCVTASTRILADLPAGGRARYAPAASVKPRGTLMSVADDAGAGEVVLASQPVKRVVHGPEEVDLVVFALANGATLRVTQHHPMVLDNGTIIEAARVDPRSSFLGSDGRPVAITAITREKAVEDVFNFETAGETQLSHVIVAEGVLTGDLKLQDELESEQHAIELRR